MPGYRQYQNQPRQDGKKERIPSPAVLNAMLRVLIVDDEEPIARLLKILHIAPARPQGMLQLQDEV